MTISLPIQIAAALALAAFPFPALAGAREDRAFLQQAVQAAGDQTVQATAHYADSNLNVRAYAQRLMRDYADVDSAFRTFAHDNRIVLRPIKILKRQPSPFFANDGLWVQWQIQAQRSAIADFENEANTTGDSHFRSLAARFLPLLRGDLELGESVYAGVAKRAVALRR